MALRVATQASWVDGSKQHRQIFDDPCPCAAQTQTHAGFNAKAFEQSRIDRISTQTFSPKFKLLSKLDAIERGHQPEERNLYTLTLGANLRQHPDHEFSTNLL